MLARTRIVKLEGEEGEFLEIHKLEGDGFVFADQFKKNLVQKIGDKVEDVALQFVNFEETFFGVFALKLHNSSASKHERVVVILKSKCSVVRSFFKVNITIFH